MAVLTREDYRARVNARVGENASDEDLSFLEDMTDTYDSLAGSEETIRQLREKAPEVKIMVGGAVLTEDYAAAIGADAYCKDAMASVNFAIQCE